MHWFEHPLHLTVDEVYVSASIFSKDKIELFEPFLFSRAISAAPNAPIMPEMSGQVTKTPAMLSAKDFSLAAGISKLEQMYRSLFD